MSKSRSLNIVIMIVIMTLILIVSFRGLTRDTNNYIGLFHHIDTLYTLSPSDFYEKVKMEWGFGTLAYGIKFFANDVNFFFFIISVLMFFNIWKTSSSIGVSFAFVLLAYLPTFFIPHQLMQIRQGLSVTFGYLAIAFWIEKKKAKSILLVVFSLLNHHVGYLFLPILIFLSKSKSFWISFRKHSVITIIFIVIIIYLLGNSIIAFLSSYSEAVSRYIVDTEYGKVIPLLSFVNIREYLMLIFFLFHRKYFRNYQWYYILLFMYVLDVSFRVSLHEVGILSGRISSVFAFSEIFMLSLLMKKYTKISTWLFMIFYFFLNMLIALHIRFPFIINDYFIK